MILCSKPSINETDILRAFIIIWMQASLLLPPPSYCMSTYVYTVYRGILRTHGCFKLSLCFLKHSLNSGLSTRQVKVMCQLVRKQILTLLNSGEARGALWPSVILSVLTDAAAWILHYLFFLPFFRDSKMILRRKKDNFWGHLSTKWIDFLCKHLN